MKRFAFIITVEIIKANEIFSLINEKRMLFSEEKSYLKVTKLIVNQLTFYRKFRSKGSFEAKLLRL